MISKTNKSVLIFLVFAFAFFISNLLRSITATLSPVLTSEFNLTAGNLGLLAGGYFLGFTCMQIPLCFKSRNRSGNVSRVPRLGHT